jgi:hypothetical protein
MLIVIIISHQLTHQHKKFSLFLYSVWFAQELAKVMTRVYCSSFWLYETHSASNKPDYISSLLSCFCYCILMVLLQSL